MELLDLVMQTVGGDQRLISLQHLLDVDIRHVEENIETLPSFSSSKSIMQSAGSTTLDSLIFATLLPSPLASGLFPREEM